MKKLTIEHRCAYAPYGVRVMAKGGLPPYADEIRTPPPCSLLITDGKMILRPLSDLPREITHNGETFVPAERLDPVLRLVHNKYVNDWDAVGWMDVESWPYPVVKELHSWHFDTFGLLDSGLAIDINTLTK